MPSVHDIVDKINASLDLPGGSDINGIAQSAYRKPDRFPGVVKKGGEIRYVGIDDKYSVLLYHKLNSVSVKTDPRRGFGNSTGPINNSYSISLVVYNNRKKTKQFADELSSLIQSQFPDTVKLEPYQSINIFFNSVILNDLQVWQQEYSIEYQLPPDHNLFQINYTVEATFLKGCFITCS